MPLHKGQAISVLGIDPGSRTTGWGIVQEVSGTLKLVDCGAINTKSTSTFSQRLAHIYKELATVIKHKQPHEAAIEQVFAAKNVSSALKLGQARGVAVAACATYELEVSDYEATLIKRTIVGHGRAEKAQVAFMVNRLLNTKLQEKSDVTDALAVAICHLTLRRFNALIKLSQTK